MKRSKILNIPNLLSISRILLLFIFIVMLYFGNEFVKLLSIFVCMIMFFTDWLDGYIARKMNISSDLGSFLDVLGDRATEVILFIFFSTLGLIPVWAPIIVVSRGLLTDYVRSRALERKKSVYGMINSKFGKIFVKSRTSRGISGFSKLILFIMLANQFIYPGYYRESTIFWWLVFTITFNLLRALPVFYDALKLKLITT